MSLSCKNCAGLEGACDRDSHTHLHDRTYCGTHGPEVCASYATEPNWMLALLGLALLMFGIASAVVHQMGWL